MAVIELAMIFVPGRAVKSNNVSILEKDSEILAKLKSAPIQTKLNKVTGKWSHT